MATPVKFGSEALAATVADAGTEALAEGSKEGTEAEASEAAEETPAPDASAGTQTDTGDEGASGASEAKESTKEGASEGTEVEDEDFFGVTISGTAEQRDAIKDVLKKQNDFIGKLLREKTEEEGSKADAEEAPAPEEITDEAILQVLGLDPDDPFDEKTAKVTLPLVRKQLAQDQLLSQLIETQELQEIDRTWRSGLSAMEKEFGALPKEVTHDRVMELAADEGITSPLDAYWRIVGPARASLSAVMQRESDEERTARKKAATTTRPTSTEAEGEPSLKSKNTKDATKEAASALLTKLGFTD
jgi:hypothetical protein